jgi:hypothetical protein
MCCVLCVGFVIPAVLVILFSEKIAQTNLQQLRMGPYRLAQPLTYDDPPRSSLISYLRWFYPYLRGFLTVSYSV